MAQRAQRLAGQTGAAMRICYVTETYPPEINGVALGAERCLRWLRDAGHTVQLVRPRQRGEARRCRGDEWRTAGGPIPLYPDLRFGVARAASFAATWRDHGLPDVVHVATPGPLAWAALRAARAEGIATSADFRTNFHAYSRHYRLGWIEPLILSALRRLHALADRTFVPTDEMARRLAAQGFERLRVVGRGVDAARFSPARRDPWLRRSWDAAPDDPVLLHVGRLAPEKNVDVALAAFERLRAESPRLRMVVVGDGPARRRLQAAHPAAIFAGVQRGVDLARHYASADVFLFPSLTDTFGNVTLEALASGLAVVAYDTAAAGQLVDDGANGWLVAPPPEGRGEAASAVDAFAAAVRRALTTARPGSALRQRAVQTARANDWPGILQGFERHLDEIAGRALPEPAHAALA